MKNQLALEIKNPCSENFKGFTPTQAGGFCNSCKEEVIDFTKMNPQEITNYFKQNSSENTCGRFTTNQLDMYKEGLKSTKKYSFLKTVGIACLSLFMLNTATAQAEKPIEKSQIQNVQEQIIVKGIVSDEEGALPNVSILLQGTNIGVETNFDGKFVFPQSLKKGDVLIFSFVGMETQKVTINNKTDLKIVMKPGANMLLGKVAVKEVYKSKRNF